VKDVPVDGFWSISVYDAEGCDAADRSLVRKFTAVGNYI